MVCGLLILRVSKNNPLHIGSQCGINLSVYERLKSLVLFQNFRASCTPTAESRRLMLR